MDNKTRSLHMLPTRDSLQISMHLQTESKDMEKDISWKLKIKKSWGSNNIPDKRDFKMKAITRDEKGSSNSTSGYLSKETQNTKLKRLTLYIDMFVAALFTIAKLWEQPKCPSMDNWIKKKWYSPGWCGSVDWAPDCKAKGCWFNSQSGHMPGWQTRFPGEGHVSGNHTLMFLSSSSFLPPPLSKNK